MATLEPPIATGKNVRRGIDTIPRRRLLVDRWNRRLISVGGQAVIALILAMFVFLVIEAFPLSQGATIVPKSEMSVPDAPRVVRLDTHQTHAAALAADGTLRVLRLADGELVLERSLLATGASTPASAPETAAEPAAEAEALAETVPASVQAIFPTPKDQPFLLGTSDGRVVAAELAFEIEFENNQRIVEPALREPTVYTLDPTGAPVRIATLRAGDERTTVVGQLAGGEIAMLRIAVEENLFTGERTETVERTVLEGDLALTHLLLDPDQRSLYGATAAGELAWWDLDGGPAPVEILRANAVEITSATLLKGGRTLVVGRADGTIENYFRIRRGLSENLTLVRELEPLNAAVTHLVASDRDRSLLAMSAKDTGALYFATSGRTLWSGLSPIAGTSAVTLAPKGDAAIFGGTGGMASLEIDNPHPEVSWKTYFGRLWYEGSEKAEAIWQSTGGTDDFESKLGLLPLLFGTLKGTIYSLFLAVPIAILGAMYTSQFVHPSFQRIVKPTVEMMASLPSVVLGLVAGLWLAPRLEDHFPALVLMLMATPFMLIAAGAVWSAAPAALRARLPNGSEVIWFAVVLVAGWAGIIQAGPWFEAVLFGGDYQAWLFETLDLRYDQRNAAVVGIAMGFAVIPIIFSIAEDAFSSVPQTLAAGSLALGANRWETVTQVVLPTASPAIFSAVMVGLGRAVGETMIVLMATGNTPIMDWSVFNGFRTLSANIAVEIPEAPHGGTLYRTLFLTALILFAFTFVINTLAELVRVRLRRKFGRL